MNKRVLDYEPPREREVHWAVRLMAFAGQAVLEMVFALMFLVCLAVVPVVASVWFGAGGMALLVITFTTLLAVCIGYFILDRMLRSVGRRPDR